MDDNENVENVSGDSVETSEISGQDSENTENIPGSMVYVNIPRPLIFISSPENHVLITIHPKGKSFMNNEKPRLRNISRPHYSISSTMNES